MPSKISDFGEKELIKRILKKTKSQFNSFFLDKHSLESLNEDAALIDFGDKYLVVTSDMLIKSAHFPEEMTKKQIGKKIVTVNVSDLAAMGAKPLGIIVSMGLNRDMSIDDFDQIIDGILEACLHYDMPFIGGDTNESPELTFSGTCIGIVEKEHVLMKSGAQIGDIVAVTGPLGLAAAGFQVLFADQLKIKDLDPTFKDRVLIHALEPEAKLKEGVLLAKTGSVTSATDITDGLVSEIGELINASKEGIGTTINEEMLPIPEEVLEIAKKTKKNPLELALYYGEDFELLLTIKKDQFQYIKKKFTLYEIGQVTSSGKIEIVNKDGTTNILTPRGYEHLGGYHEKGSPTL
ncbi:MAG: thiamine-phosphate kinase [Euryarchaeota archaeon]|nr:thiamine-phosphate kinase [Euryarchaeota archaeon]